MEQSNQSLIFETITTDDKVIVEAVDSYNKIHKTDFQIVEFIYDEVVFAKIKVEKYKASDIFDLGYFFHSLVALKRNRGEIDW
ncbi:MAG: hypothetical protein CRN43_02445 [Candidatus Nephrothrix sp. EaCA]|nr:MAG: hypothetical protein CRN43_02445 [Candidatus Nephrothrix sp. EaCA]